MREAGATLETSYERLNKRKTAYKGFEVFMSNISQSICIGGTIHCMIIVAFACLFCDLRELCDLLSAALIRQWHLE